MTARVPRAGSVIACAQLGLEVVWEKDVGTWSFPWEHRGDVTVADDLCLHSAAESVALPEPRW